MRTNRKKDQIKATKQLKEHIDKYNVSKMALSVEAGLLLNGFVIIEQTFDRDLKLISTGVSHGYPTQIEERSCNDTQSMLE